MIMSEDNRDKSLLTQEKLNLRSWGLPTTILEKYAAKGIENMFPWQVECLTSDGVLAGRNLVYSAPTSAGKTMVAEMLTIQTVLERKKKVIIILPFISVVREKMLYFQNLLGSSGVRVEGFMGSHAPPGGLRTVHIAICTIEKANSLINRLLEDQGLDTVGCVVVDELHLLGDPHRGYLLELLLTKLKYMCLKDKSLKIQVVGMSATLPNIAELAAWLDAALYVTNFRPIPLTEYLKVNSGVFDASTLKLMYNVQPIVKFKSDTGDVINLCLESLLAGHSVLVFCPTRSWCETCAQQIAAEFRRIGYEKSDIGLQVRAQLDGNTISDVLEQLKRCPAGLDQALGRSVAFGVAFHHAGLTMDERDIVEGAFRTSVLRVLVATSTLSSGVNLPARRVLIRCPPRSRDADVLTYRQMVGRAGRMGKDTEGESFLICNGSERTLGEQLVRAQLPPVESSLVVGDLSSSLKRAVLEVIASGVVSTTEDVEVYTGCTFLASSAGREELGDPLAACVEYLHVNEFVRVTGQALGATPLAEACLSASLPPDQGLKLLKELHRARQCFVLESELHVIYQVTPYSVSEQWGQLDWLRVLSLWEDLPISMKRVGELVGVEERFLVRAVRGTVNHQTSAQKLAIHRRFYTALALQDLVNEVPLPQVAIKFDCTKGMLQSLQQSASTFAGMVTQFSRRLGWSNVELLVSQFCARLQFGAQRELLDLLRLDCLTAVQARALYNGGIQGLADLATASVNKVEKYLRRATPFQSENEECEASDKCRIWLVGRCGTSETEAANILIQEARQYLERELGLQSANWGNLNSVSDSSVEESLVTQSLDTPPRPIGHMVTGADRDVSSVIHEREVKQTTAIIDGLGSVEVKNASVQSSIKSEEIKSKSMDLNTSVEYNCVEEPSHLKISNAGSLKLKEAVGSVCVQGKDSGIPTQPANISLVNVKKRGSLDIFDSPEKVDNNYYAGINIEEKNNLLKISSNNSSKEVSLIKCLKSPLKYEHNKEIVNSMNNQVSEEKSKSGNLATERPGFSPLCEDRTSTSHSKGINISGMISTPESKGSNKSVFFDSPLPIELIGVRRNSTENELDANVGGESLLEISSFLGGSEQSFIDENNLLDANVGGDSLLEMSSFIAETEDRKRKRSIEETSVIKRLRISTPGGSEKMNYLKPKLSELQVSKITSTNSKQVTTSTPTSSKYLGGSINFENTFASNEDVKNTENPVIKEEVFVKTNSNDVHTTSAYENNGCNEDDISFDLKLSDDGLSENEFGCDTDLVIDSKICDLLDYKNASSKSNAGNKNSQSQNILNDSVNIDSKLGALLDFVPSTLGSQKCTIEKETPLKDYCNSNHSKENEYSNHMSFDGSVINNKLVGEKKSVKLDSKENLTELCSVLEVSKNNKLSCHSLVIDSKRNSSINNANEIVSGKEKVSINSNLFTSNIINTQICDLLDQVNRGVSNFAPENTQSVSNQFENSGFDINTQLCNVLDRNDVINGNKENVKSDRAIWTESMEVREILDLSFDEDTVFGTPVPHQKSMSFKKCSRKNKTNKVTKVIADEKSNIKTKVGKKQDSKVTLVPLKINGQSDPELLERQKAPNSEKDYRTCFPEDLSDKHQRTEGTMTSEHALLIQEHNKPVNHKTIVHTALSAVESRQITQSANSLTDSVLEAVFASSVHPGTPMKQIEEVGDSQQTPVTPLQRVSERVQDVNSPTVNLNRTHVEVVSVSVSEPGERRELLKSLDSQRTVALALRVRTKEDKEGGGIGARIVRRRGENSYPCCHRDTVLTAVVVCWEETKVFILQLDQKNYKQSLELLRNVLSRGKLKVCMWEAKDSVRLLRQCCQLPCAVRLCDPTVAEWLLKPHVNTPTLKQLARTYGVSAPQCSEEAGFQAVLVWQLCRLLNSRLKQAGLYTAYTDIEMPTQLLLAEMEIQGVCWDREYVDLLWTSVEEKMVELQNKLFVLSGKKFNLRSRTDISKIKNSLKDSCETALCEFNSTLRNWRVLNSLKTRNMSPLLMQQQEGDVRVRGSWETHTITGRISMQEPNLQHVPRDIIVDDQVFSLRTAFVAGRGNSLVSADFCQLELRLLAHFSQDAGLHQTFTSVGDVFTSIAAEWNAIPIDQVTDAIRQHTKQLCYGLIYGMGLRTLAEEMGVEEPQAAEMVERFHRTYPGIQSYIARCVEQCRARGYVTTIMGRQRSLPEISSHNKALRAQAERQAVNTTIQGSAADIAKAAMLRVDRTVRLRGLQTHLIIHLHDELIYEVADSNLEEFVKIIRREMETAIEISVPLPVKVKKGSSWGHLEPID